MFQAILHQGAVSTTGIVESAPEEVRAVLAERLAQLEDAVLRTIKVLDY